jgi:hypothetical protein
MPVHTMLLSDKGVESLDMHHPYLIALSRAVQDLDRPLTTGITETSIGWRPMEIDQKPTEVSFFVSFALTFDQRKKINEN